MMDEEAKKDDGSKERCQLVLERLSRLVGDGTIVLEDAHVSAGVQKGDQGGEIVSRRPDGTVFWKFRGRVVQAEDAEITPQAELSEGEWYELVELKSDPPPEVELNLPHTTIQGPIENILVVVLDREVTEGLSFDTLQNLARTTLDSAKRALKGQGWEGGVALTTSDTKLMRFRKVAKPIEGGDKAPTTSYVGIGAYEMLREAADALARHDRVADQREGLPGCIELLHLEEVLAIQTALESIKAKGPR